MAPLFRLACLGVLICVARPPRPDPITLQTGDIVLQASKSERAPLIERASRSPYSHVGVVEVSKEGTFVIEAIQPVSRTPLARWRARGKGGRVTVLRLREVEHGALIKVVAAAKRELGKPYDATYRWDDERLYCSELVVKAFQRGAGVTLGERETVDSLELSKKELSLARKLGIDPHQELVTPGSLTRDAHLQLVAQDVSRVF